MITSSFLKEEEANKLIAMKEDEFDKFMCEKFPDIFIDRYKPMTVTCMCWGFCIGPGWRPLLFEACKKVDLLQRLTGLQFVADQVKEKFGSLRFYNHLITNGIYENFDNEDKLMLYEIFDDIIDVAEEKSFRHCEKCGEFGSITVDVGWILTLCNKCAIKEDRMTKSIEQELEYKQKSKETKKTE